MDKARPDAGARGEPSLLELSRERRRWAEPNFRNYKVWQDAVEYSVKIYQQTDKMPWFEKKGLCDQLQRASVSIGSNIAEGSAKPSNADFARFLDTALGSTYEVETQLLIANKVGYIKDDTYQELLNELIEIERQIAGLIRTLRS